MIKTIILLSRYILIFQGINFILVFMAEIINHNAEDNPQLNELYEILLLAGYFRIRIASLKAFDKVIGGMAWCITSSNFAIDVDYNDEMQIGQKIKVSEIICDALKNMKCPYSIQPFQLQGLDVNNIYPVVQWLVKLVYETRYQRQKYNRQLSVMLGRPIIGQQRQPKQDLTQSNLRRIKVNRSIASTKHNNPIRVYSALLESGDVGSVKMYNKLLHLATQGLKKNKEKSGKQSKSKDPNKQGKQQIINFLQDQKDEDFKGEVSSNDFGSLGKFSIQKLQKILEESRGQIQQGIMQHHHSQQTSYLSNNNNNDVAKEGAKEEASQEKIINTYRMENQKYEVQLKALHNQLQSLQNIEHQLQEQVNKAELKYSGVQKTLQQLSETNHEMVEIKKQIESELKQKSTTSNSKLQKMVQKRGQLKKKKAQIKKKAKGKLEQLSKLKQISLSSVPQIDEEAFRKMMDEAEVKKKIYNQKYQILTTVNQQLAVLQRKAENITSPSEIAQYHQRFIELFEAINCLIEQKRTTYTETTNLQATKKVVQNYMEILNGVKQSYAQAKKKQQKKQLAENLKEILGGLQANMNNSQSSMNKLLSVKQKTYNEYVGLIKLEREYLKHLRALKVEYQNAEKYYK